MLAIATIGCVCTAFAYGASFKCTTKAGITYQDKPCPEAPLVADTPAPPAKDANRGRDPQRLQKAEGERPVEATRVPVSARKAEEASEHSEWLERAARKSEALKRCAELQVKCNANMLRDAAMYLSESQLESALGAPIEKQALGISGTSYWNVRVTTENGFHNGRLTAAWGLCTDDRNYFATGQGQRACTVTVD